MSTDIPTGTVTFLFTDIEGSTRLAQAHPDAMRIAQARHDAIVRDIVSSNNGYVFQVIGDAVCAAFATAIDAVSAAIGVQLALCAEHWGETPIKVRMGLHTGEATVEGGEYHGYLTLAKVQRVMSVAHGGQILVSGAAAELLQGRLSNTIMLRDLKKHRLKGFPIPEHLWQVTAPNLQQEFPPLQSLDEVPNNLPEQLTSFIGRKREKSQVRNRLEKNRLVTLTGAGGIGKTRLALRIASDLLTEYSNGVWLVELAPIAEPPLVSLAVCAALGITPEADTPPLTSLTEYLKPKSILLVLDNCEHLIDACAQVCDSLLHACPNLRILATSREALGIDGESIFPVPSLSLPDPGGGWRTTQESEAVQLFLQRARAALPEFKITDSNASSVARVCQRLDGVALALELAAARVKILTVDQIASRLDDAFRLLTGGSRTALPRQQTLRASIDWSYNLLSEGQKAGFRRLSIFAGGSTIESAECVCGDLPMLDVLADLVDKSLVTVDRRYSDQARYYMQETIRQYAREKLLESGEADLTRDRHLAFFLSVAERAEPELEGRQQSAWLDWLELEIDNLRTALAWSLEDGLERAELGLKMASHLWWFWFLRGHSEEAMWLEQALAATRDSAGAAERAKGLSRLAWVRFVNASVDESEEALALGMAVGPVAKESVALALLGKAAWASYQADGVRAQELAAESVRLFREVRNRRGLCEALTWLGMSLIDQGRHTEAVIHLEESLRLAREAEDENEISFATWQLGEATLCKGDYVKATSLMSESLALYKKLKVTSGIYFVLRQLGQAALQHGDSQQAAACYREALDLYWRGGNERGIAECLECIAEVAAIRRQTAHAARLMGAAEALRECSDTALYPYEIADYERTLMLLHSQIDDTTFTRCWGEGRAMTAKQAVEYAMTEDA